MRTQAQHKVDGSPGQGPMFLVHPTVRPGVILLLAGPAGGRAGLDHASVLEGRSRRWLSDELSVLGDAAVERAGAGRIEGHAEVGLGPGQRGVAFLGPAVLAGFVVLLAAGADGERAAWEGKVDGVAEARRLEAEHVRVLLRLFAEVVRIHHLCTV